MNDPPFSDVFDEHKRVFIELANFKLETVFLTSQLHLILSDFLVYYSELSSVVSEIDEPWEALCFFCKTREAVPQHVCFWEVEHIKPIEW